MALKNALDDFEKALQRLKEAYMRAKTCIEEDYNFFRDSAIQRFEFTVEIFWKTIKNYLKEIEGIDCRSPKSCIRDFFATGKLNENETVLFLEMIDDRNMTSYTYKEEVSEIIFSKLGRYIDKLEDIYFKLKKLTHSNSFY